MPDLVLPATGAVEPTPPELEDLTTIATSEGLPLDEAVARYGWQQAFSAAVERVSAAYPHRFAGSAMTTDGALDAVGGELRFTGAVPRDLGEVVGAVPAAISVFGGQLRSREGIERAVERAHHAAVGAAAGDSVSSEFDEATDEVVVTVYSSDATSLQDAEGDRQRVGAAATLALASDPVVEDPTMTSSRRPGLRVELSEPYAVGNDTIRGGALLGGSSSSSFACTSGWPVNRLNSTQKGLVTADHCPDNMSYSGRSVLTWRSKIPDNGGDVQYMSSTETVGSAFYYAVGEYRTITGRGNPSTDQTLCKFGRTSGNSCDTVRDTFTCRDNYCNLVSMDNREAAPGDSGGPWYYGSTAYGIHSGYHFSFPSSRDQFTPLYNVLNNMGLQLRTG